MPNDKHLQSKSTQIIRKITRTFNQMKANPETQEELSIITTQVMEKEEI